MVVSAPAATGSTVFVNIGLLVSNDAAIGAGPLGCRAQAAVVAVDGRVAWVGDTGKVPEGAGDSLVDVGGRAVLPGFVDSHTHLVFAGDRSAEFAARLAGHDYEAGGILNTVTATRAASEEILDATVARLAAEALSTGTTTLECKSGYGLTTADEERSLRVAQRYTEETTFLGAHTLPAEFAGRPDDYVALVCSTMLEACAPHARWVDVFCEVGAFDADQAVEVLRAGGQRDLVGRVHANQLGPGPGVQVATALGAASADHCTFLSASDIDALSAGSTVATLLPGAEFSTRSPYADGRRLLDAGVTVALASDCNPGTSYTTSIPWCIALATREMGVTVDEAVWAATAGGAAALRRADIGHLGVGARADLLVLDAPSHLYLAYRPGVALVAGVWRNGKPAWPRPPAGL
jgi:imidazolonepropionase